MASGLYASTSDVQNQFGIATTAQWSNLDNSQPGAINDARVQQALNWADSEINNTFRNSRYAVPLVFISGTIDPVVVRWDVILAGKWLYESRGWRDKSNEGDHITALLKSVNVEMSRFLVGQRAFAANLAFQVPTVPAVVATI